MLLIVEFRQLDLLSKHDSLVLQRDHVILSRLHLFLQVNDLLRHPVLLRALELQLAAQISYLGLLIPELAHQLLFELIIVAL